MNNQTISGTQTVDVPYPYYLQSDIVTSTGNLQVHVKYDDGSKSEIRIEPETHFIQGSYVHLYLN
jgi:hypothetical protein